MYVTLYTPCHCSLRYARLNTLLSLHYFPKPLDREPIWPSTSRCSSILLVLRLVLLIWLSVLLIGRGIIAAIAVGRSTSRCSFGFCHILPKSVPLHLYFISESKWRFIFYENLFTETKKDLRYIHNDKLW